MEKDQSTNSIQISELLQIVKRRKKLIIITTSISISFGFFILLSVNTEYKSSIEILPESSAESFSLGALDGLSGLANIAGVNLPSSSSAAFEPFIYPEIIKSKSFLLQLLDDSVQYKNQKVTVREYFNDHYESDVFERMISALRVAITQIRALISSSPSGVVPLDDNLLVITEEDLALVEQLGARVDLVVNYETDIITISAKMPNRIISSSLTQVVYQRLYEFIDDYRTLKLKNHRAFLNTIKAEKDSLLSQKEAELTRFLQNNRSLVSPELQFRKDILTKEYENTLVMKLQIDQQLDLNNIEESENKVYFKILKGVIIPNEKYSPKTIQSLVIFFFLGMIVSLSIISVDEILIKRFRKLVV